MKPPQRTPKLQEKPSALKREHPVLKNMKILDIFPFLWVIFALLDPDPDSATQINADPYRSGSGYGSGSETLVSCHVLNTVILVFLWTENLKS
jgi:hypothetical protein